MSNQIDGFEYSALTADNESNISVKGFSEYDVASGAENYPATDPSAASMADSEFYRRGKGGFLEGTPSGKSRDPHICEQTDKDTPDNPHARAADYRWVENAYASRSGELQNYGITSSEEWLDNMIRMDAMLSRSPEDAIKMLAEIYHVDMPPAPTGETKCISGQSAADVLSGRIIQKQVDEFADELDAKGNQKHPFFREVVKDICNLLQKGVADNLEDAYDAAVWLNGSTRDKLIARRSQEALELKSKDAAKSKEAAFAPKGKADFDTKDLSLREELELRFAALNNEL